MVMDGVHYSIYEFTLIFVIEVPDGKNVQETPHGVILGKKKVRKLWFRNEKSFRPFSFLSFERNGVVFFGEKTRLQICENREAGGATFQFSKFFEHSLVWNTTDKRNCNQEN